MRRRTLVIVGGGFGGVLILSLVAILVGPRLLESEIEERVRARLEARGIVATWGEFAARGGGSFLIDDVRVEVPRYGATLESDRMKLNVAIGSIMDGDIRLTEVSLEPARLVVDLDQMADDAEEEGDAEPAEQGEGSEILRRLLENPPVVNLTDAQLSIRRGDAEIAKVTAPLIAVEESWGNFKVEFDGDLQLVAKKTPGFLRNKIPWRFSGKVSPGQGTFEYSIESPLEGDALLSVSLPELLTARVTSVWGAGRIDDRTAQVNLGNLELIVGGDEYAALHARAPRAVVSRQKSGRPRIEVIDPSIYATPSRRAKLLEVVELFGPRKKAPGAGDAATATGEDEPPPKPEPAPAPKSKSSTFARFSRLASRTDVELRGLSVGVHLENEDGTFTTLTLLERLDTTIRDGLVRTLGSTAGGKVFAEAEVLPGQSWPHYLIVRAHDVHLEKIPGLARKRSSLPSRGTSGTVAGIVDVDLAMTLPPRGMDGPLWQLPGVGEFRARWREGVLDLEGVADVPVEGIDSYVGLTFTVRPEIAWMAINEGLATYGPMRVAFSGEVTDFPLDTEFELEGQLEEIECQTMFRALPKALLGPYANVEFEGAWAPKGWLRFPLYRPLGMRSKIEEFEDLCAPTALNADKDAWPNVTFASRAPTGPHGSTTEIPKDRSAKNLDDVWWLNRPFVKQISEGLSDAEEVEIFVGPGTPTYVPIEKLPRWVGGAAYLSEQIDFYLDGPVSLSLMKKAMRLNLEKGRFVYGGSTVTQQLVKNLFLTREKTLARKLQEALIAWRIDEAISKDRVLELYLNCIEFGTDVYGIGPAARHYFQKDARYLTPKEAVFLAMLKPAPWFGERIKERGTTPKGEYFTKRIAELHDRLVEHGFITKGQLEQQKPLTLEWKDGVYQGAPALLFLPLLD